MSREAPLGDQPPHRPYCVLPWIHLFGAPDGYAYPCCFGSMKSPVGDLRRQTVQEIWDGLAMRSVRAKMLSGKIPEHCLRCKAAEKAGYHSLRTSANEKFAEHFGRCTRHDPTCDLVYLDFRFSNLCNFRCRTCGPDYSSAWQREVGGGGEEPGQDPVRRWGDWRAVQRYVVAAEEINFAGGEPLISDDHYQMLKLLLQDTRRHLPRLTYNTNLSTLRYKELFFPEVWIRFPSVRVSVSIDALGRQAELIRKGLRWEVFERNIRQLWQYEDQLSLGFTITVSLLNVQRLEELLGWLDASELVGPRTHVDINFLDGPAHYSTRALPASLKKEVSAEILELASRQDEDSGRGHKMAEDLRAVVTYMNSGDCSSDRERFLRVTSRLDAVRGEDTFAVLPELSRVCRLAASHGAVSRD